MAKINNKSKYPFDINLSLDDFIIGSDAETITSGGEATRNYKLSGVFSTFKNTLNLASIEYCFAGGSDPDLDETDIGYFTTNSNETSAPAITQININKQDLNGVDITAQVNVVAAQPSSFIIRLSKPSVVGQIFYFAINGIVDNTTHFTFTVSNFVGANSLVDLTTYSLVFELAGVPSIYTEVDPVFTASPAGGITAGDIANWNEAYSWGDHALAGYQAALNGTGIVKSTAGVITYLPDNTANWDAAFSWGDHALAGYLTSFTETDPVFTVSPAAGITNILISQWNTAYSWGDHALAGYITGETDPVFTVSPAAGITTTLINNWNAAYSWGDHAAVGYLTSVSWGDIIGTLSDQTDLQLVLDAKVNTTSINTFAGLDTVVADKSLVNLNDGGTFLSNILVPDDPYAPTWDGSTEVPTKNALYDKVETLASLTGDTFTGLVTVQSNFDIEGNVDTAEVAIRDLNFLNEANTDSDKRAAIIRAETHDGASGTRGGGLRFITRRKDTALALDFPMDLVGDRAQFNGVVEFKDSVNDFRNQRADSRIDGADEARLHWFGQNDAGAARAFKHAWYDGSSYIYVTAQNGGVTWSSNEAGTAGYVFTSGNSNGVNFSVGDSNSLATLFINKGDGANMQVSFENNYYRWRRSGGGSTLGWRWQNFGSVVGTLTTGGNLTITGTATATNFILSSDERLKTNIRDIENEYIDVQWKKFNISNNSQERYGAIAQELEKKHPEFVRTDGDGYKAVAYIDLLVAKVAELEQRIKQLENAST